jgi:hypothetical protein
MHLTTKREFLLIGTKRDSDEPVLLGLSPNSPCQHCQHQGQWSDVVHDEIESSHPFDPYVGLTLCFHYYWSRESQSVRASIPA